VALLLAVAALLAAAIAARASLLASDAGGKWQSAVRTDLKLAAAMTEDVRFVYDEEAPVAFRIATARVRAEAFRAQAGTAAPAVRAVLLVEAQAQDAVADALLPASEEFAADPKYARPDGGFDVGKRLADVRAEHPDLVALDPAGLQAAGDAWADRAVWVLLATVPVGMAFLFGALAQAYRRRRSGLVLLGWGFVVVSAAAWIAAEVLA
jgi:hypothetical protein